MAKPRLFASRRIPGPYLDDLGRLYEVEVWEKSRPPGREELAGRLRDADAAVTTLSDRIDCRLLSQATKLRIIAQYAVGYDNIDVGCATRLGVYVTNTPGVLTEAVADLTWALILAAARRIVEADRYVRSGEWGQSGAGWSPTLLLGLDVYGKTLGVVGMGRIGRAVARRARGFGMKILYYSRRRLPPSVEEELGAEYASLEELLRRSDIVTLHVPLTRDTRHMIDAGKLALLKRTAIIVNTSRGGVIDTEALLEALREKRIAAAALDVFEEEPLPPGHPLTRLDNVVLAPHIGSATVETRERMARLVAENLKDFAEGRVPRTLVNKEVLRVRPPGF